MYLRVAGQLSSLLLLLRHLSTTDAFCATCSEQDFPVAAERFSNGDCVAVYDDDTLGWYSNDGDTVTAVTGYDKVTGAIEYAEANFWASRSMLTAP